MSAINRLYNINNRTTKKSVNIDDSLYKKLIYFTQNKFDATVSDLINVAIEDYSAKNNLTQSILKFNFFIVLLLYIISFVEVCHNL